MMLKKRGLATVLVLIILLSFSGVTEEDDGSTQEDQPTISGGVTFLGGTGDPYDDSGPNCHGVDFDLLPDALGESECSAEIVPNGINYLVNSVHLGINVCPIAMANLDPGAYDDLSVAFVLAGYIVDHNYKTYNQYIVAADAWEPDDIDCDPVGSPTGWEWSYDVNSLKGGDGDNENIQSADCHNGVARISPSAYQSYVCALDHIWYPCYELNEGLTIFGEGALNYLYECTFEETRVPAYQWEQRDSDLDRDGFSTSDGDCQDDPQKDPIGLECPTIEDLEEEAEVSSVGKSIEQVREDARDLCLENPQRYSQCAICINPGAAEVCGDNLNNDCGGEDLTFDVNVDDEKTPDSCHENQAACEQAPVFVGEEATEEKGTCSINKDVSCEEHEDCPDFDEGEECDFPAETALSASGYNTYGEFFSWIDADEDGGYCCGYGGVNDLGKTGSNQEGNYICLNKNLVGTEPNKDGDDFIGNLLEGEVGDDVEGSKQCQGEWCWINAKSAQTKFQIVTLRKPGEEPFDAVSNNDDWFVCKEGSPESVPEPAPQEGSDREDDFKKTHRFYCYDEGNRWSLAECTDTQNNRRNFGIKGRYEGEGLFSLPLVKDETPDIDADENDIVPYREGKLIDFYSKWYKKFYDDYHYLDFSDYDYFNFMVHFVGEELNLPAGVNLKIYGPGNELYFDGEVLGYVQNGLLFSKDSFMHIKVPIGDYKAVKSFEIGTSTSLGAEVNTIQVKDIYLSKEGVNPLCSGQDAVKEGSSSWLEDADFGDPDAEINGAALCTNLYGPNAWLGSDEELDDTTANCCGNAANEYYSGRSVEVAATTELAEGEQSEFNRYGCWNSQPIASGETIMNVEFEVSSTEEKKTFEYTPLVLDALKLNFRRLATSEAEKKFVAEEDLVPEDYISQSPDCTTNPITLDPEHTFVVLCNFTLRNQFSLHRQTELWFKDISTDKIEVDFYDMITHEYLDTDLVKTEKKDLFGNTYLEGPAIYLGEDETERVWNRPIAIVASLKPDTYFPSEPIPISKPNTDKKTFSCKEHECLFPLPGNPPYGIVNTNPNLYELYFVTGSLEEELITPANKHFEVYGNVKARKIAKQVLFYNEGDEEDSGFYGCNAASFLQSHLTPKNSCSVIDGMFCSPSVIVQPPDDPKDRYTAINSWSDEEIKYVGYNTVDLPDPTEDQTISEYYQQLNLQLESKTIPIPANKRNHTTSVLPARNFLANAEFVTLGAANQIPYWDIIKPDGSFVKAEEGYTQESLPQGNKVVLGNNEKLRSERIAVSQNVNLHLSQAQECNAKVFLVDNDGNSEMAELPQFPTGDASYVIVEFSGACEVEKPMLQLIDELGPAEYAYQTQEILENFDARSGVACCPDNHCWNGYACVKPMAGLSTIAEHVADGRDYRCVDGQWKQAAFKFDWNQQRWGFCPEQNECFVLPQPHGSLDNTAQDFYEGQGNYPLCIKDSEYIFDNYCNQGNWTSRTKFVATKLLEVAENSEFVLYCSPYKETLLDYENVENYLAGDLPQAQQPKPGLPGTLTSTKPLPPLDTCYSLDAKGKGLIADDQNTCINNVCVLRYKDGGEFKAAFATTLNKALDDPDSFLLSLGIPQSELQGLCQEDPNGEFVECDLSNVNVPGDLYYSSKLNAVIYAKDGLSLEAGVMDKIVNFFQKLFGGSSVNPEKEFIADVQTFRDAYLLDKDDKKVRAVKEVFPDVKETLIAEYENFETPVCDYVKNIKAPPELELELLEEVSGAFKIHCAINDSVQRVVLDAGSDFFWPQLTGKLRVNEYKSTFS